MTDSETQQQADDNSRRSAEQAKALQWLDSKWTNGRICPIDGNNNWTVSHTFEMREFRGGDMYMGGPVLPVFGVTCSTCGFTHFFSAIMANVAAGPKPTAT
jgi:hypothetical protein